MAQIGNNGNELTLIIPDEGKEPWYSIIYQLYTTISAHDHSGEGRGTRIGTNGISDEAINDLKILLRNNEWLRSAGVTAGDAAINILKINGDGDLEIGPQKLIMSNGVVIDNNGASASRFEGELTVSDDLNVEGNILGPNLVQTSENGTVSAKNIHLDPSDADPLSPIDGQLQYSDGTHRDAGLWQYQGSQWVSVQGEVGIDSVYTAAIQDEAVGINKLDEQTLFSLFYPPSRQIVSPGVTNIIYDGFLYKVLNLGKTTPSGATVNFNLNVAAFETGIVQIFAGGDAEVRILQGTSGEIANIDLSVYMVPVKIEVLWDVELDTYVCVTECL